MPNNQKRKGYNLEHYLERDLKKHGIDAKRMGQPNQPDLLLNGKETMECKCKKGLKSVYDMLGKNTYLALKWQSPKAKGKEILVVMRYKKWITFIKGK